MTTSSTNYTGLYSGNVSGVIPNTAYGNANVVGLLAAGTDGANTVSNVVATGNVTANYFIGNGSQLTGITSSYGNANVTTLLAAFGSNTISTTGTVTAGNITGSNILTPGVVSATGNVAGAYILGNGSQLTGLPATYSNANVVSLMAAFGSNTISTTGNVTTGNLLTPGKISATGNITTQGFFIGTFLGNIVGNLIVPGANTEVLYNNNGNADASSGFTFNSASNVVTVAGNIVGANVSTVGNVTGAYILGNGSQLTGIAAGYSNANVTSLLAAFGSNSISTTGNITASYFTGNGSLLTSITAGNVTGQVANALVSGTVYTNAQPNITSVGTLTSVAVTGNTTTGNLLTGGLVSATGNITGNYIIGNGSQLTGLPAGYSNADVATFLASFGSNSISTTGNIAAGYFTGNGSLLTSITGANVTGTVANATFATTAGSAGSANTAVTVTGNAQANITSVGVLTSLSVSGNVTAGNVIAPAVYTSNITGDAGQNVTITAEGTGDIHLDADSIRVGDNNTAATIVTHGTGNLILRTHEGDANQGNITLVNGTNGNIQLNPNGTGQVTTTAISATGNITANYFLGNGSQLTGITTSAGGANTQIQFNNGNAFAGNAAMTFDTTTGNVTLANLIIGTGNTGVAASGGNATRLNTSTAWTNMTVTQGNLQAGQIVIGNGFFGNLDLSLAASLAVRGAKASLWDSANVAEAGGATARYAGLVVAPQVSIANIANNSTQVRGGVGAIAIGGGSSANIWSTTAGPAAVVGWNQAAFIGQPNTVQSLGNVTLSGATASLAQMVVYAGSNVGNAAAASASFTNTGNITNMIGVSSAFFGAANVTPTTVIGYYMPNATGTFGIASSNQNRAATNYYFLRSDDNVAQCQLGSLRAYHEFQATGNTTGTWNIDKNNGQVQRVSATGNITIGTYTNFVTTANDGTNNDNQTDTVTLIIEQGATPYTVTMPTGNAAIKYAANVTTVSNVANTTTMIAITAYRTTANAAGYLTTISPAFS